MSQGSPTLSLGVVSLGVGIDTARYGHHVSFLDEQKRSAAKAFHFTESAAGYQQLQAALTKLSEKHPGLHFHIRLDAAGQYAENLLQWLHRLPFSTTISVGQPARNKAYRQVHFDKRKADPVESLACARFAIVERPAATPHNPPEFQQLRDVVALILQKVRAVRQEQDTFAALATLVELAWQALPDGPAKRLRTIPGIGLQTSAALVAKIVSIERFALWTKDCDFDPDFEAPPKAAAESASNELRACEAKTIVAHKNPDQPRPDPVLWESQPPGTNALRVSRNRAQKKGTPRASKGGAPLEQEVTVTSATHLPPSGPRPVALPQSQPPSARRPTTVRAASQ